MKIDERDGSLFLRVKVVPNASRTAVAGVLGDALKVQVAQPPEAGKANEAVIALLAQALGVPGRALRIVAGSSHSRKTVEIAGMTRDALLARLAVFEK
jgi:uncharacterized protein (TIGR00251 family)